jgi:hypothetical protein
MFRTCHAYVSGEGDSPQWLTPLRSDRSCRWTIFPVYQRWELISYASYCILNYQRQLCSQSQFPRHWSMAFFSLFVHRGSQTVRGESWDKIRWNFSNAVTKYNHPFLFRTLSVITEMADMSLLKRIEELLLPPKIMWEGTRLHVEPRLRSRYSGWLRAGRPRDSSSSSERVNILPLSMSSCPALRTTQPPIQWTSGALSPEVKEQKLKAEHSLSLLRKSSWRSA